MIYGESQECIEGSVEDLKFKYLSVPDSQNDGYCLSLRLSAKLKV